MDTRFPTWKERRDAELIAIEVRHRDVVYTTFLFVLIIVAAITGGLGE